MNDVNDEKIREEIAIELRWMPSVDPGNIGIAVKAGVVTLTGHATDDPTKNAVERLTRRVGGVRTVVNEIAIHQHTDARNEAGLARAVVDAFGHGHHSAE